MMNFLRYCLSLFWVLFAGSLLVPSATWGYDAQTRQSTGYDDVSFSAFNYDSATTLSANKDANEFIGTGDVFRKFAELIAAEGTVAAGDDIVLGLESQQSWRKRGIAPFSPM